MTFTNSNIYGNNANDGGGVRIFDGTVTFNGCNINGNTAEYYVGGGVNIMGAQVTFTDCNIHNNKASEGAGAVFIFQGTVTFFQTKAYANSEPQIVGDYSEAR